MGIVCNELFRGKIGERKGFVLQSLRRKRREITSSSFGKQAQVGHWRKKRTSFHADSIVC